MTTLSRGVEPPDQRPRRGGDRNRRQRLGRSPQRPRVVVTRAAVSARIPRGSASQHCRSARTRAQVAARTSSRGRPQLLTRTRLKQPHGRRVWAVHVPLQLLGPTGSNRDTHVLVRKCPELVVRRKPHGRPDRSPPCSPDRASAPHLLDRVQEHLTDRKGTEYMQEQRRDQARYRTRRAGRTRRNTTAAGGKAHAAPTLHRRRGGEHLPQPAPAHDG